MYFDKDAYKPDTSYESDELGVYKLVGGRVLEESESLF